MQIMQWRNEKLRMKGNTTTAEVIRGRCINDFLFSSHLTRQGWLFYCCLQSLFRASLCSKVRRVKHDLLVNMLDTAVPLETPNEEFHPTVTTRPSTLRPEIWGVHRLQRVQMVHPDTELIFRPVKNKSICIMDFYNSIAYRLFIVMTIFPPVIHLLMLHG